MKKELLLTALFVVSLIASIQYRNHTRSEGKINAGVTAGNEGKVNSGTEHETGPEEFLKFHQGIRTRSDEQKPGYPTNYQWAELQKVQRLTARKSTIAARTQGAGNGVLSYTERGPGNVPGRTRGLLVDPDDATRKTWFVGSAAGGIWKTIDAGNSWQWLTPSIPNLSTTTLAMAQSNHNTIYAGTGEGFGQVDGVDGNGIFKSTDRGQSWALLANSSPLGSVNRLAVDPGDPNIVLAAANNGIYRTTDGGSSWTQVYSGLVQDLRPTPGNFSVQYAGLYGVGVLKSIDGGITWNRSSAGMSPGGRVEIAVSPMKTDRIIASTEGALSGVNSDLYLSDDGGTTWYLVTLSLSSKTLDYLGSQGWYDNTVAFSPYNKDVVYVGGIGTYQITLGTVATGTSASYSMQEINTTFLTLVNFNASNYGGRLEIGAAANSDTVEIRFGKDALGQVLTQKAHRFLVPDGSTSGVPTSSYTFQDYVDVPFQVWDTKTNTQLMVSFRDQDRNGNFDLLLLNTGSTVATDQSREYIFVNNVPYNAAAPNASIATTGGQVYNEMYFFWPVLASGATWDPTALPNSKLQINYQKIAKYTSTVSSVADPYADYDGKNNRNFVHADQHNIYPIPRNDATGAFQLLMANDGGVFLSGTSTSPGTTQGEWVKAGNGYNTSQFYGADKKPGAQEYVGGMQDNATYFTPTGVVASAGTAYNTNSLLLGDGFEALWHSIDGKKLIGGAQFNNFSRSLDGGATWAPAITGLTLSGGSPDTGKFPFISKLASSKQAPDILYTIGSEGVWKSIDFGGHWVLTPISAGWGTLKSFANVEVSRANASIVWAGCGMGSQGNLFVSTDAGKTFTAAANPAGYKLGNVTRIATHPTDERTAYALFSFAQTAKILMTKDLGQTWTDISGFGTGTSSATNFPDVAVYSLYVRPDNTNIIWAGTEIGIIESLDGGSSWNLLTEFPSVAVWNMKGQDDEIVIVTHGRGIWTAQVPIDQNANFPAPVVVASGTSPQAKFLLQVQLPLAFDSVQIKINTQQVTYLPPGMGSYVLQLSNVPKGTAVSIQLIGYKGSAPIYTDTYSGVNLNLSAPQHQFYDYFVSSTNFYLTGLSVQAFGAANMSMQSPHNYAINADASGTLLTPIIVSTQGNTSISFQDVAIVQPGATGSVFGESAFNDFVIVEATKDGLTWTPVSNGYNASANANWLSAFNAAQSGSPSLSVAETFDLKNNFSPNDTLLIRFRLHANSDAITGWGWSVDNLYVQQEPLAVEPTLADETVAYPNPTSGKLNVGFTLYGDSEATINIWDVTGRKVLEQNLGILNQGQHLWETDLYALPDGLYLVRVKNNSGERTLKISLRK